MAYGLEIYNSSGNTVLSYTSRVARFVQNGAVTVNAFSNTTVTVTNMVNNDSWDVFLASADSGFIDIRYTLNTGFFQATNNTAYSSTVQYWVVRS